MCVCVCVCVCARMRVCLKYLCRSGSDWPEIFNMAATWFKGVQQWICLDYNDTVNKWFQKWFTNFASIVNHSHHSHVRTRANHCRAPPPESTDAQMHPNHVTNLRCHSSKTQPLWVSILTIVLARLQTISQFLNRVDRPSKTGLMINNVHRAFSPTLPSHLLCVWCRKKRSNQASLTKVSASRKCLQAKKPVLLPFLLVEKSTTPTQTYMANYVIWLLRNRGKLWEGWWRKSDSDSDGDRDNDRDGEF